MKTRVITLFAIALSLFGFSKTFADTLFEGVLLNTPTNPKSENYSMIAQDRKTPLIFKAADTEIAKQLKLLSEGDYLSGQFKYNSSERFYYLTSIESFSLKMLIAKWSDKDFIFHFVNQNSLKITARSESEFWQKNQTVQFKYTILSGDKKDEWVILMTTSHESYYANAKITKAKIQLELFTENGELIKNINLVKLSR